MTITLYANDELVSCAWLALAVGSSDIVGTTLPQDTSKWSAEGFVQVTSFPGGDDDLYVPVFQPIVQVDCWACTPTSGKPPWGVANNLVMAIRHATYKRSLMNVYLELPGTFPEAMMKTAYMNTLPRRIEDDPAGYARYTMELRINWVPVAL